MSNTNYKQVILEIATQLTEAVEDADKFDRGQDAAGIRLRKLFLEISKELKTHRLNIQDVRNNRKNNK
jgi:polyphosphate kinase 2 (PPK2 family)